MKSQRRINPNIIATGLTSLFTDISTKMVYSVMPLFLMSIGASKTTISLIEGIAESTASILKAVSGRWSDRIGRNKPFMVIGYGITTLVTPLYAFIWLPVQVLVVRFTERIGKGIRTAPRDSLISSCAAGGKTGRDFGFQKAMDNSGAIVGPLLAFLVMKFVHEDYRTLFLIASIPAVIGLLAVIIGVREKMAVSRQEDKASGKASIRRLPRRFWLFLAAVAVFSLGNSSDALLLIKTSETGIDEAYVPFIYMIFNMVSVIFAIPAGKLSDKIGREKMICAGFLVYALTYFFFGAFSDIRIYILLFVLYGIYSALTDVSQKAFVSDLVGKQEKGTGYGLYHTVLGLTLLPASLLGGWMYDKINSSLPFYFGAAMSLAACLLMAVFFLSGKRHKATCEP